MCELESYEEGMDLLNQCIEKMKTQLNNVNLFIASIGLMKMEIFLNSQSKVKIENQIEEAIPINHPIKSLHEFLVAFLSKDLNQMRLKRTEYFEKQSNKVDIDVPLLYILHGEIEEEEEEKKNCFKLAKELCEKDLQLMDQHRFIKRCNKMLLL